MVKQTKYFVRLFQGNIMVDFRPPNSSVSIENFSITNSGRTTIPLRIILQTPVQRKGSLILDPMTDLVYYSNGVMWISIASFSLNNVGVGIELYVSPSSLKTLTSNDASIIITDNSTEVDLSAISLSNVGVGIGLFAAPSSLKTLTSNDASIIITDNGTEVDLSAISLNNVGTGIGLFVAPSSLKTLTGNDSTIIITDNGTEVDLSSPPGTPSPYRRLGDEITHVSASVGAIVSGRSNSLTASTQSLIGGSAGCLLDGSRTTRSAFIGSLNGVIDTSSSSGRGRNCVVIGSNAGRIGTANRAGTGNGVYSSLSSIIQNTSLYCVIVGSNASNITQRNMVYNGIYSSISSSLRGERINESAIMSSRSSIVRTAQAGDGERCSIIGSSGCQLGHPAAQNAGINCGIYSSLNSANIGRNRYNAIIAGNGSTMSGNSTNQSVLMGRSGGISRVGNFLFSDSGGGSSLLSSANNGFSVRCSGGARFFSDTATSIGVSLASGSNFWAMTSDRTLKENINILDSDNCRSMAEKFLVLPICKYNFIGCPKEQVCYGPMAQDWHEQFGTDETSRPITDEFGEPVLDSKTQTPLYEMKPAKDPLKIEMMDMIGIMMSTIQHLQNQRKKSTDRMTSLINRISVLEAEKNIF